MGSATPQLAKPTMNARPGRSVNEEALDECQFYVFNARRCVLQMLTLLTFFSAFIHDTEPERLKAQRNAFECVRVFVELILALARAMLLCRSWLGLMLAWGGLNY